MKEYDLCDIWRLRYPLVKRYTWRGKGQGRVSTKNETLHRRLDYILISDELQPYTVKCDIIPAPSTDHSAITMKLKAFEIDLRGPSYWKFNNSLIENEDYCIQVKAHVKSFKETLDNEKIADPQLRWELIKYEIRKFSMKFSKQQARKQKSEYTQIENRIKNIEEIDDWVKNDALTTEHEKLKNELEEKSNYITEGVILRSKAKWYEAGEKNTQYF